MTAEIAILNRAAVALAADSAVTVDAGSEKKIFTTANKLFMLSKYHPVGIMIYGGASFMDVNWETIVKVYRQKLLEKSFPTLKTYMNDFLMYISKSSYLQTATQCKIFVERVIVSRFSQIRKEVNKTIENYLKTNPSITNTRVRKIASGVISAQEKGAAAKEYRKRLKGSPFGPSFVTRFIRFHSKSLKEIQDFVFEKLPLSRTDKARLSRTVAYAIYRNDDLPVSSGVVVAGFGGNDIFPSLYSYEVYGIEGKELILKQKTNTKVSTNMTAAIVPFAQREMVHSFMEGVDPFYQSFLQNETESSLSSLFQSIETTLSLKPNSKISRALKKIRISMLENYLNRLSKYREKYHSDPVINTVASLPKPELAAMAESLINLTSFKRRMSPEAETVGGAIDVAVISKGDGFVWIHRKHYFDPAINHHFFDNYYKECTNG